MPKYEVFECALCQLSFPTINDFEQHRKLNHPNQLPSKPKPSCNTQELLSSRQSTHGDFHDNARFAQQLRQIWRNSLGWETASPEAREALDMIATKLSRILSGQPGFADHWDDIAGYAKLVTRKEEPSV